MKTDESHTNKQTSEQTKTKRKEKQTSWERELLKCLSSNVEYMAQSCKRIRFFLFTWATEQLFTHAICDRLKSKFSIGFVRGGYCFCSCCCCCCCHIVSPSSQLLFETMLCI